jgi:ATP-binding cassette subfamily B protein
LTDASQTEKKKSRSLKPLGRLTPYVMRYRGLVTGAVIALALAAVTSLALPLAVRRMIDHGFSHSDGRFINSYFVMLMVMAVVLALASAMRYYFVITLGERIVSDLRRDVFAHVTRCRLLLRRQPVRRDRLAADRRHHADQVRRRRHRLGGAAQYDPWSRRHGHDGRHQPKLSSLVLAAIPLIVLPLVAFGRSVRKRSRAAQDTLADATAFANEQIGAVRTVQAFTGETAAPDRYGAPWRPPTAPPAPPSARARC